MIDPERLSVIEKQNFAFGMSIEEKNELVRVYRLYLQEQTECPPPPDQL